MAKKKKKPIRETDLYGPVKTFLEGQGSEVKGEVGAADIVAVRGDEPPVIVELKTSFSLALFHQAIERLKLSDTVYVAVPRKTGKAFQTQLRRNIAMCRRLGLGLTTVRLYSKTVEPILIPALMCRARISKNPSASCRSFRAVSAIRTRAGVQAAES